MTTNQSIECGVGCLPVKATRQAVIKFFGIAVGILLAIAVLYLATYNLLRDPGGDVLGMSRRGTEALFGPAMKFDDLLVRARRDSAVSIVESSLVQARSENKRVMLLFSTKSCLPCQQLEKFLSANSSTISKQYVVSTIDLDTTPDNDAIHEKYRNTADGPNYYPWIVILDADGQPLFSSDGPPGSANQLGEGRSGVIALPFTNDASLELFLQMVQETGPNITLEDVEALRRASHAYRQELSKVNPAN
ncbi:MAG: thioredoxin family protein [Planctomycetales bacterium]|nr:thioredoxin family protein [Planctomycetales bacterium]